MPAAPDRPLLGAVRGEGLDRRLCARRRQCRAPARRQGRGARRGADHGDGESLRRAGRRAPGARARGGRPRGRRPRPSSRARHGARRRRPGLARLRRQQAEGVRGGRDPLDPPRAPRRRLRSRPRRTRRRPRPRSGRRRDPRPDAASRAHRPGRRPRRDLRRQGRRRPHAGQRRPPGSGTDRRSRGPRPRVGGAAHRTRALHAGRRDRDPRPLRGRARGRRSGGDRPLDPRRPADGEPARERERHRDRLPLADP